MFYNPLINTLPSFIISHIISFSLSPHLSSTTRMFFHPWSFIERNLLENFGGCMNGQWRLQRTAKKVDIKGFSHKTRNIPYPKRVSF